MSQKRFILAVPGVN